MKSLDKKPVRKEKIYCSPWCGGGCTWAAYQEAMRRAEAMRKVLGETWKVNVHENLGWHAEVMSPTNTVRVIHHNYPGHQGFSAFGVSSAFSSYGRTCRAAVRNLAEKLQAELERHESTLEELRKALR